MKKIDQYHKDMEFGRKLQDAVMRAPINTKPLTKKEKKIVDKILYDETDKSIFGGLRMPKSKIHVDIDPELKRQFKVIAAQKGKKIRGLITMLVADYVKKNKS